MKLTTGTIMYDLHSGGQSIPQQCDPNWEEIYEQKKIELDAIRTLIASLINFVTTIQPNIHASSPIATFLGTLSLDVMLREEHLKQVARNIENNNKK